MPQTDDSAVPVDSLLPPVIPTGIQVFDLIMAQIEPDLVSTTVTTLDEKYKDETPAQAKARAERYVKAYEKYEEAYARFTSFMNVRVAGWQHITIKRAEEKSNKTDASELSSLESDIQNI